jgi:hypothetical protein
MYHDLTIIVKFKPGDLVVDIGGNDGSLLTAFRAEEQVGLILLNIDPSENLTEISRKRGIPAITSYFSKEVVDKFPRKAKVITSTNVFQHLRDIDTFVANINGWLDDSGVWLLEFPHWAKDLESGQFDQIYHEHVYYYNIQPLRLLFEKHGLMIIDAKMQAIHGGSMRLVMAKVTSNLIASDSIAAYLKLEERYNLEYYSKWSVEIKKQVEMAKMQISAIKSSGKKIAAFGAAAKGCIFLNTLGLTHEDLEYIIDDTDIKQGKYMPGTGLEVSSRARLRTEPVDFVIILPHNFADYIKTSLRKDGYSGEFLQFLPILAKL